MRRRQSTAGRAHRRRDPGRSRRRPRSSRLEGSSSSRRPPERLITSPLPLACTRPSRAGPEKEQVYNRGEGGKESADRPGRGETERRVPPGVRRPRVRARGCGRGKGRGRVLRVRREERESARSAVGGKVKVGWGADWRPEGRFEGAGCVEGKEPVGGMRVRGEETGDMASEAEGLGHGEGRWEGGALRSLLDRVELLDPALAGGLVVADEDVRGRGLEERGVWWIGSADWTRDGVGRLARRTVWTEKPLLPFSLTVLSTLAPPPALAPMPLPVPRRTIRHSYLSLKLPSPLGSCLTQSRRGKSVRMRKRSRGGLASGLSDLTSDGDDGTRMAVLKTTFSSGRSGMDLEEGGARPASASGVVKDRR